MEEFQMTSQNRTLPPRTITTQPRTRAKAKHAFLASEDVCAELARLGKPREVQAREIIFCKGQPGRGVFLIKRGRVALSAGEDPTRITRIAEAGSLLGLPATVTGRYYSLTAETVAETRLIRVGTAEFRHFLRTHPTLCYSVVRTLAEEIAALRRAAVYML